MRDEPPPLAAAESRKLISRPLRACVVGSSRRRVAPVAATSEHVPLLDHAPPSSLPAAPTRPPAPPLPSPPAPGSAPLIVPLEWARCRRRGARAVRVYVEVDVVVSVSVVMPPPPPRRATARSR